MAKREILQLGDPALHEVSAAVDPRAPSTLALVRDLADTLAAFAGEQGFGRAIAAPQLGTLARVLFVRMPGGFTGALHNPVVVAASSHGSTPPAIYRGSCSTRSITSTASSPPSARSRRRRCARAPRWLRRYRRA
jgi:hypothetical protein